MIHKLLIAALIAAALIIRAGEVHADGKGPEIESVLIEGNDSYSDKRLFRLMLTRPSSFLNKTYYSPEVFTQDRNKLELYYQNQGYLKARIEDFEIYPDSARNKVSVRLSISEGGRVEVVRLVVTGNEVYTSDQLLKLVSLKPGMPLLRRQLTDGNQKTMSIYANNGYLDARINSEVELYADSLLADVTFSISEGRRYEIGDITLAGLEKTRPQLIRRLLTFNRGEPVNYSKLLESQRKVYLSGLFESVYIRPLPSRDTTGTDREILVEMKEIPAGEFNAALGYGSVEKVIARGEVLYQNLGGMARKAGLEGEISFINALASLSFSDPYTFGSIWKSDLSFQVERRDEPSYDLDRVGGQFTVGRTYGNYTELNFAYRHENSRLSNLDIDPLELPEDLNTRTQSIINTLAFDTRDNLFNTDAGILLELTNELGVFFMDNPHTFYRVNAQFRYFRPLAGNFTYGGRIEAGWIKAESGFSGVPLNERFYLGGPNTVRGFGYRRNGPVDISGLPVGGRFKLLVSLFELRRPVYKMIGLAVFSDAGGVWRSARDFSAGGLRITAGLGLRVNTPIGLGRFDYAAKLDRKSGESRGQFHLSMGQAF